MTNYNILILSVGRRVELVNLFKKASNELNIKSEIYGADASFLAPALYFCDKYYKLPKVTDSNYIGELIKITNESDISLIIPTIDTELMILALNKEKIEALTNAKVLVSNETVIDVTQNKVNTQLFFEKNNFLIPKQYNFSEISENSDFPLFIKPKEGSSSKDIFKINNYNEFKRLYPQVSEPIIQEYIEGDEYTVDVFLDFDSNVISIVPRLRIATRSGEIAKGKIVKDSAIINKVKELMYILNPIGHITVQLMKTVKGIEFIEINARFGGGAPMSIESGANSPANLYKLLIGETLKYHENYTDGLVFLRFDSSIALNQNQEVIPFD